MSQEIHQILTIHSPGTWNMFSKKLSNSIKMVAVMPYCIHGGGGGRQKYVKKIAVVFQVCFQMPLDHRI